LISHNKVPVFQQALAAWFEKNRRQLPWRTTRTLYRTVVSEFMLQQTQVTTVLPYFERWMTVLPDFEALASAKEETVLKLWEGLGYYRRARNLHRLARELAPLDPKPTSAADWEKLPGVGPYTAAAITSLSFGEPAACVDGNVVRILARVTCNDTKFPDGSKAVRQFTPLAVELLDATNPGRHNEAMMELGATVCTRTNPRCNVCPLVDCCAAAKNGVAPSLPRIERPAAEKREVDRVWLKAGGKLLLHRIPETSARMRGLYELPTIEQAGWKTKDRDSVQLLATHKRSITRFRITERIYRPTPKNGQVAEPMAGLEWVPLSRIDTITFSGPHRRWISALLKQ
jgi:A/G-specific adenine glycosylase